MIDKTQALAAWKKLDAIIDSLDWQGVFDEQELREIEEYMATMLQYMGG